MSEWGQGFIWGVLSAGPVAVMVMGLLCAAGRASEAERRRGYQPTKSTTDERNPPRGGSGLAHPWADENRGAA